MMPKNSNRAADELLDGYRLERPGRSGTGRVHQRVGELRKAVHGIPNHLPATIAGCRATICRATIIHNAEPGLHYEEYIPHVVSHRGSEDAQQGTALSYYQRPPNRIGLASLAIDAVKEHPDYGADKERGHKNEEDPLGELH